MINLFCRNRVVDYKKWKQVFDSHGKARLAAGLHLLSLGRSQEEPNNVFFVFRVDDLERARTFISAPDASDAGRESGVIDGEFHFVESD